MKSERACRGLVLGVGLVAFQAQAQPPPSPVRYTEARSHSLRRQVRLLGTVEARTSSLVASEVEGLVTEMAAREGDRVRKGQPLVHLRKDHVELRLAAAQAQLREAQARSQLAESNLARARELFDSQVLSRGQLDDALSEFDARNGRVAQLSAEVGRLKLDLERCAVAAPFAGVVVAERTHVGEWLGRGQPVVELISLYDLEVRVEVPEHHFAKLRRGAGTTVTFAALPGHEITGRISAVIPQASAGARTFPVKVRIANERGRIGAGMLAEVAFAVGDAFEATVVPKDAVITRGQQRLVYKLNGDNTVTPLHVETGASAGAWTEVRGDVAPGTKVVVRGNERLRPGQAVNGQAMEYALP